MYIFIFMYIAYIIIYCMYYIHIQCPSCTALLMSNKHMKHMEQNKLVRRHHKSSLESKALC